MPFLRKITKIGWMETAGMILLATIGTAFIASAGAGRAAESLRSMWVTHAWTTVFGLVLYFLLAVTDYRKLLDWTSVPIYILSCLMLVAVLALGSKVYGGRRWLWFFQPSEVAKIATIMFMAHVFGRAGREGFRWFLAGIAAIGVPALLILAEPDLGTALVMMPAAITMLLAARTWTKGLIVIVITALLVAGLVLGAVFVAERQTDPDRKERIFRLIPLHDHQIRRLRVFLFPETDIRGAGYNLRQAEISIGSGSVWGKGFRKGEQKHLGYLPPSVSMNDFIFAVLAEETGFAGSLGMLVLFLCVVSGMMRTAFLADDDRGRLLAIGVATLVFSHAYVNVAMSIGLMPITGLPLPFISAGRTFLLVMMVALGIVQSVNIHRDEDAERRAGRD